MMNQMSSPVPRRGLLPSLCRVFRTGLLPLSRLSSGAETVYCSSSLGPAAGVAVEALKYLTGGGLLA